MKHNDKEIGKRIRELQKEVSKLSQKYGANIFTLINDLLEAYLQDNEKEILRIEDKIFKEFDDAFVETYEYTSMVLRQLYGKIKHMDVKNVQDLTYSADGKKFPDRVQKYFDETRHKIDYNTKDILKQALRHDLYRILDTELKNVSETVKKEKRPIPEEDIYLIQVIEGCGDECGHDCIEYNGVYSIDDEIPWPPYHPHCTGIGYYDYTDDPSEIEDLDLDDTDLDENI